MSELANYSIETDNMVLLSFADGRKLRVPVAKLAHHLAKPDLEKVLSALKLRKDFIRDHTPKILLVLAAGGLVAALMAGPRVIAGLTRPPTTVRPAPGATSIVRSIEGPAHSAAPSVQPKVESDSTVAVAASTQATKPVRPVVTVPSHPAPPLVILPGPVPLPISVPLPIPPPQPLPSPLPSPQPDELASGPPVDAPTPAPVPTPQIPNQGKVLDDSTQPPAGP